MKSITKAIAVASLATAATTAQAELSATAGIVSDYVFRGVQTATGSAYASVDFEEAGFYAGVWAIDLEGTGLEVDLYLGYGMEISEDGFSWNVGYTRYEYTDNEGNGDLAQNEFALDLGIAGFGFQYVYGQNDQSVDSDGLDTDDQDYNVYTLSYSHDAGSVLVGYVDADDVDDSSSGEAEYYWAEVSKSAEVAGFDVAATLGVQFGAEEDGEDADSNDGYIVFDISRGFDL